MPARLGVFALTHEAVCRGAPRVVEGVVVTVSDSGRDGGDLTDVGAAVGREAERPGAELLVQWILEHAGLSIVTQRRISMRRIQASVSAPAYAARIAGGNQ